MKPARDDGAAFLLCVERVEPATALGIGDGAGGDGGLGGPFHHSGIEAPWFGVEREKAADAHVLETGAREEHREPPREPAVHRAGVRGGGDDPTRERTVAAIATSKAPSGKGRASALPSWNSMRSASPAASASSRATARNAGLGSTPTARPLGPTRLAISRVTTPLPHPTSSTRSPSATPSRPR